MELAQIFGLVYRREVIQYGLGDHSAYQIRYVAIAKPGFSWQSLERPEQLKDGTKYLQDRILELTFDPSEIYTTISLYHKRWD